MHCIAWCRSQQRRQPHSKEKSKGQKPLYKLRHGYFQLLCPCLSFEQRLTTNTWPAILQQTQQQNANFRLMKTASAAAAAAAAAVHFGQASHNKFVIVNRTPFCVATKCLSTSNEKNGVKLWVDGRNRRRGDSLLEHRHRRVDFTSLDRFLCIGSYSQQLSFHSTASDSLWATRPVYEEELPSNCVTHMKTSWLIQQSWRWLLKSLVDVSGFQRCDKLHSGLHFRGGMHDQ